MKQDFNIVAFKTGPDTDVQIVCFALEKLGANVTMYDQFSALGRGDLTVLVDGNNDRTPYRLNSPQFQDALEVDVLWNRRHPNEFAQISVVDPHSHNEMEINAASTLMGLRHGMSNAFVVNSVLSTVSYSNKIKQLLTARHVGLQVPRTLFSNNVSDIEKFLKTNNGSCVKPHVTYNFNERGPTRRFFTTKINSIDEFPREAVECAPLIYQEFIQKKFEVRLTAFGRYVSAVKIPLGFGHETVDWRVSLNYLSRLSHIEVPNEISALVFKFMAAAGLRIGVFDFVVTEEDAWVFLEANTAGRFLWQEIYCDNCILLEPFCKYLLSKDDNFTWDQRQRTEDFDVATLIEEANGTIYALESAPEMVA